MKEYNLDDLLEMEDGTVLVDGLEDTSNVLRVKYDKEDGDRFIQMSLKDICSHGEWTYKWKTIPYSKMWKETKLYKPIEYVTFQEALESCKRVRVKLDNEHILTSYISDDKGDELLKIIFKQFLDGNFLNIQNVLIIVGLVSYDDKLSDIFTEKCWLIEE